MASPSAVTAEAPSPMGTARKPGSKPKLHGRAFYESLGSPKFVVAPMVDQSEFVGETAAANMAASRLGHTTNRRCV